MSEEEEQPPLLMCSGCYTPTPIAEAHVVPGWNASMNSIVTTYRCNNCWRQALDQTRAAVRSRDSEMVVSFCEFLERQGFTEVDLIRNAPPEKAEEVLLRILDMVQQENIVLSP